MLKKINWKCGSLALSLAVAAMLPHTALAGEAAEPVFGFDELIVTATKFKEEVRHVPASVTVITAEDLQRMSVMTVDEALSRSVGIFTDRRSGLSDTSSAFTIRGFNKGEVMVTVDGIPRNSPYNGGANWNSIPLENIARIEVVRGPASSLYGGNAVGGVVNIITKDIKDSNISARVSYGSDTTWKRSLNISQRVNDRLGVNVGYEGRSTDGYTASPLAPAVKNIKSGSAPGTKPHGQGAYAFKNSEGETMYAYGNTGRKSFDGDTYWLKLDYKLDAEKTLTYSLLRDEWDAQYRNPQTFIRDSSGRPLYNGYVILDGGARYFEIKEGSFNSNLIRHSETSQALHYTDAANKINFNIGVVDTGRMGYSKKNDLSDSKAGVLTSSYPDKAWNADFQKTWEGIGKNDVIFGVNWKKNEMHQVGTINLDNYEDWTSLNPGKDQPGSINGGKTNQIALYAQDKYTINDQWKAYAGLRWDRYEKGGSYSRYKSGSVMVDKTSEKAHYTELSPKLALEYLADADTTYYMSYGHAFTPPTLYTMYRWTEVKDEEKGQVERPASVHLKPETSDTLELGVKKQLNDRTAATLALYHTKTKDMHALVEYDKTHPAYSDRIVRLYENIDEGTRKGIEFDLQHKLSSSWGTYLNYAWQKTERNKWSYQYGKFSEGRIPDVPRHILHFGVDYQLDRWNANIDASYVSERNDDTVISGLDGSEDARFLVDLRLGYRIDSQTTVAFAVNNVFNKVYYAQGLAPDRSYTVEMQYHF